MTDRFERRGESPLLPGEFEYWPAPPSLNVLRLAAAERVEHRQNMALDPFPNDIRIAGVSEAAVFIIDTQKLPRYLSELALEFDERTAEIVDGLRRTGHAEQAELRLQARDSVQSVVQDIQLSTELTLFLGP